MRQILFILQVCLIGLIGLLPCQLQGQTSTSAANRSAEQAQSPQRIRPGAPFQSSQNSSRISSVTTFAPASGIDFNYTRGRAGLVYVIRELGDLAVFVHNESVFSYFAANLGGSRTLALKLGSLPMKPEPCMDY